MRSIPDHPSTRRIDRRRVSSVAWFSLEAMRVGSSFRLLRGVCGALAVALATGPMNCAIAWGPATLALGEAAVGVDAAVLGAAPGDRASQSVVRSAQREIARSPGGRWRVTVESPPSTTPASPRPAERGTQDSSSTKADVTAGAATATSRILHSYSASAVAPNTGAHIYRIYEGGTLRWEQALSVELWVSCSDGGAIAAVGRLLDDGAASSAGDRRGGSGPSESTPWAEEWLVFRAGPGSPLALVGIYPSGRRPPGLSSAPGRAGSEGEAGRCYELAPVPVMIDEEHACFYIITQACSTLPVDSEDVGATPQVYWWRFDLESGLALEEVVPEHSFMAGGDMRCAVVDAIGLPGCDLLLVQWLVRADLYADVAFRLSLYDREGRERWFRMFERQFEVIDGSSGRPRLRRMSELVEMSRGRVAVIGPGAFVFRTPASADRWRFALAMDDHGRGGNGSVNDLLSSGAAAPVAVTEVLETEQP